MSNKHKTKFYILGHFFWLNWFDAREAERWAYQNRQKSVEAADNKYSTRKAPTNVIQYPRCLFLKKPKRTWIFFFFWFFTWIVKVQSTRNFGDILGDD
jgi:hypothetical protein